MNRAHLFKARAELALLLKKRRIFIGRRLDFSGLSIRREILNSFMQ